MASHEPAPSADRPGPVRASVVIPLYNGVDYTRACLTSLAAAGWDDRDEVILVDNASTDATPEYLASLDRGEVVITNDVNRNFAGACNQGAAAARGEWVLLLNNDTEATPGWLDVMLDEASATGADVVGARLLYPDRRIQHGGIAFERGAFPRHLWRFYPEDHVGPAASVDCQAVTGACMLIRRSLYIAAGGLDEGFVNGFEDLDFCLRVRSGHGARIRYCGAAVLLHHESVSPGRSRFDYENAGVFLDRWRGKVRADVMSGEHIVHVAGPGVAWRPALHKDFAVRCYHRLARSGSRPARGMMAAMRWQRGR